MKKFSSLFSFFLLLSSVASAQSYVSIFRNWGFIGDSLCSGEMECYAKGDENVKYVDLYEYSWGQQMCRLAGCEGWNFSHGGQTARGWLAETEGERGWGYAESHPKQAYIIALGYNDYYKSLAGEKGFSKAEFRDDMRTIISNVKSVSKDAVIFVLTRPREDVHGNAYDEWNDVIRQFPLEFDNVYLIDFYKDAPVYDADFRDKYYLNGHLSPAGYLWTAVFLMDN